MTITCKEVAARRRSLPWVQPRPWPLWWCSKMAISPLISICTKILILSLLMSKKRRRNTLRRAVMRKALTKVTRRWHTPRVPSKICHFSKSMYLLPFHRVKSSKYSHTSQTTSAIRWLRWSNIWRPQSTRSLFPWERCSWGAIHFQLLHKPQIIPYQPSAFRSRSMKSSAAEKFWWRVYTVTTINFKSSSINSEEKSTRKSNSFLRINPNKQRKRIKISDMTMMTVTRKGSRSLTMRPLLFTKSTKYSPASNTHLEGMSLNISTLFRFNIDHLKNQRHCSLNLWVRSFEFICYRWKGWWALSMRQFLHLTQSIILGKTQPKPWCLFAGPLSKNIFSPR